MNIKQPAGYDISHYEEIVDFSAISPRPALIITKATEGISFIDDKFERFFAGMKKAGIFRGAYHFHRKAFPAKTQADHFLNVCQMAGVMDRDILVLDVEEGGETAAQLMEWFERVRTVRPFNPVMIYSRKNLLDPILMTTAQKNYFKQIPVWTAGYPYNPDDYFSPPASYIPDQTRWGPVWMWQYSDKGVVSGIQGQVDLNWLSAELLTLVGGENPGSDVTEAWFDSRVLYTRGHRDSPRPFNFHVTTFRREDVERIHVNGLGFQGTGMYFWETRGKPDIVINGGHADYSISPPVPLSVVVSDGNLQKASTSEYSIQFDDKHQPIGMLWFKDLEAFNAVGISDILLLDGIVPASVRVMTIMDILKTTIPFVDNTYVDPRNAIFWNDTEYILIDIDGRNDGTQGLTRLELAHFAKSIGAKWGGNLDGGDSNTLIFNKNGTPVVKNNPPDGKLHAVANHVGFWIKSGVTPPPDGGTPMPQDTYITNPNRPSPLYSSNGKYREDIPAATVIACDWLWPDGPLAGMRKIVSGYITDGDRFIKDVDIDLYTAPPPPPPPTDPTLPDVPYTFTLGDGVNYQKETITGILKSLK